MFRYHFQEQIAEVIKVILQQWVSERIVVHSTTVEFSAWGVGGGGGFFFRRFTPFFALLQVF